MGSGDPLVMLECVGSLQIVACVKRFLRSPRVRKKKSNSNLGPAILRSPHFIPPSVFHVRTALSCVLCTYNRNAPDVHSCTMYVHTAMLRMFFRAPPHPPRQDKTGYNKLLANRTLFAIHMYASACGVSKHAHEQLPYLTRKDGCSLLCRLQILFRACGTYISTSPASRALSHKGKPLVPPGYSKLSTGFFFSCRCSCSSSLVCFPEINADPRSSGTALAELSSANGDRPLETERCLRDQRNRIRSRLVMVVVVVVVVVHVVVDGSPS